MRSVRLTELLPTGLTALAGEVTGRDAAIVVCPTATSARCPLCGTVSGRVHSRYARTVADLPVAGRPASLRLRARRFFCDVQACPRRIFTERVEGAAPAHARRTSRLEDLVHCLSIALGGRPAARLAHRLSIEISNDTLLRIVRRRGVESAPAPSAKSRPEKRGEPHNARSPPNSAPTSNC